MNDKTMYISMLTLLLLATSCASPAGGEQLGEGAEALRFCCTGTVHDEVVIGYVDGAPIETPFSYEVRWCGDAEDAVAAAGEAMWYWTLEANVVVDSASVYDPLTGENSCSPAPPMVDLEPDEPADVDPDPFSGKSPWECLGEGLKPWGGGHSYLSWRGWSDGLGDAQHRATTTWSKQGWVVINDVSCWTVKLNPVAVEPTSGSYHFFRCTGRAVVYAVPAIVIPLRWSGYRDAIEAAYASAISEWQQTCEHAVWSCVVVVEETFCHHSTLVP